MHGYPELLGFQVLWRLIYFGTLAGSELWLGMARWLMKWPCRSVACTQGCSVFCSLVIPVDCWHVHFVISPTEGCPLAGHGQVVDEVAVQVCRPRLFSFLRCMMSSHGTALQANPLGHTAP